MSYAKNTTVPIVKSQFEILGYLEKSSISKHAFLTDNHESAIVFERKGVGYKISIQMPDSGDKCFRYDGRGRALSADQKKKNSMRNAAADGAVYAYSSKPNLWP